MNRNSIHCVKFSKTNHYLKKKKRKSHDCIHKWIYSGGREGHTSQGWGPASIRKPIGKPNAERQVKGQIRGRGCREVGRGALRLPPHRKAQSQSCWRFGACTPASLAHDRAFGKLVTKSSWQNLKKTPGAWNSPDPGQHVPTSRVSFTRLSRWRSGLEQLLPQWWLEHLSHTWYTYTLQVAYHTHRIK